MIPHLLSAGWAFVCSVLLLFSFCFFVKLALANRVDGAKGLHNSKTTNLQAFLRFRNGLRNMLPCGTCTA